MVAELVRPTVNVEIDDPTPAPDIDDDDEEEEAEALVVEPGDLELVRYDDAPSRPLRVRLSKTEHKPDVGAIHIGDPLAIALLGSALEDEIEIDLGSGKTRTGVIERIERASAMAA